MHHQLLQKTSKKHKQKTADLETKLRHFEKHYENHVDNIDYKVCKQQQDATYKEKAKSIRIRSKWNWYEHGEKSTKCFLNLEKHCAIQRQMQSVIINQDKITNQAEINKQKFSFYQSFIPRKVQIQTDEIEAYLENTPLPKLTNKQILSCEDIISEDEVFRSFTSMKNIKSPENDVLSKEFYECFWDEIKKPYLASIHKAFLNQELSSSN